MTDPGRAAPTRRAALLMLAGASVGLAAACDGTATSVAPTPSSPSTPGSSTAVASGSASVSATGTGASTGSPAPDPERDRAAVAALLGASEAMRSKVVEARRGFRRLRPRLATLVEVHDEHARVLRLLAPDASPVTTVPGPPAADPAAALGVVRQGETALREDLASAALVADSGDVARVLASMSAGLAAALVALAEPAGAPA